MTTMLKKRSYGESDAFVGERPPRDDESSPDTSEGNSKSDTEDLNHTSRRSSERDTDAQDDWHLVEGRNKKRSKNRKRKSKSGGSETQVPIKTISAPPIQPADNKPSVICAAPHTLTSSLRLGDLQQLILYCLADGIAPQWISVRHRNQIRKAIVLMIPGLEKAMFSKDFDLDEIANGLDEQSGTTPLSNSTKAQPISSSKNPDDYLPSKLDTELLPPYLQRFGQVFPQMFPVKAPGDDKRVHSPVAAILNCPLTKSSQEKQADKSSKGPKPVKLAKDFVDKPTPVTLLVASSEDLFDNEYVLHPILCPDEASSVFNDERRKLLKATQEDGWRDANIQEPVVETSEKNYNTSKPLHAGRKVYAIDCEMCKVQGNQWQDPEYALTRISIVDWDGKVLMDELVKPAKPIIDYVTAFSGITKEMLAPVTTTLSDIQSRLLDVFTQDSILIGHSLNSDLNALKMTHPYIVDTSVIYPHPKGAPFKSSLKWLTQKYLNREIQKHDGNLGHDSIEDARAALDLVKAKCQHGLRWGTPEASGEDIFKRLARTPRPGASQSGSKPMNPLLQDCRTGAVVDHGRPERTLGKNALVSIACSTDDEVANGIKRAANGDEDGAYVPGGGVDFVFARMRELEALRGWSTDASASLLQASGAAAAGNATTAEEGGIGGSSPNSTKKQAILDTLTRLGDRIAGIYSALPKCTLFIVYSGVGDPREMKRLGDMLRQFRREFAVKKWDELSVKWTDDEEQALKRAVKQARSGIAFATVT